MSKKIKAKKRVPAEIEKLIVLAQSRGWHIEVLLVRIKQAWGKTEQGKKDYAKAREQAERIYHMQHGCPMP